MNIWTAKKVEEKLNYMHNNPVKRGLVKEPGDWAWSSWRFYFLRDASVLAMDRVP
jgi:putative transposase